MKYIVFASIITIFACVDARLLMNMLKKKQADGSDGVLKSKLKNPIKSPSLNFYPRNFKLSQKMNYSKRIFLIKLKMNFSFR